MLFFILIILSGSNVFAAKAGKLSPFELWKQNFIEKSSKKGLSKSFLRKQLKNIKYQPNIIDKDRNQVTSSTKINYPTWIKKWIGCIEYWLNLVNLGKFKLQNGMT